VTNLTKYFSSRCILNALTFQIQHGERAGVVGANGVGKSTLLRIIAGDLDADSGTSVVSDGITIGYLAQVQSYDNSYTLQDWINQSLAELRSLESRMRELESAIAGGDCEALDEYGEIVTRFEAAGGYDIDTQISFVFSGLGISHLSRERLLGSLSGGERARVALGLLLLRAPQLLLLDEPTNHLDWSALKWLESYLRGFRGSVLIVSHDRHFLKQSVNCILEIDEHTHSIRRYPGDYDAYREQKRTERVRWEADYAAQQEEIRSLQLMLKEGAKRNSNYRAPSDGDKILRNARIESHESTVSRRVRDAAARLERLLREPIPKPPKPLEFDADFAPALLTSRFAIRAEAVCKAYEGNTILREISLEVANGSHIVITGRNGAGKSTLLRILAGIETADSGVVRTAPGARPGYLPQEEPLAEGTVYEAFAASREGTPREIMNRLLWTGLFRHHEVNTRICDLSAGQRRKVSVARLMASGANLLLLDEPTNHLSMDVLEELEAALRAFRGTIIAISHDRRFLSSFPSEIWELADGSLLRATAQ
jgi:macrolide transport system ATP-binding/permease protein